MTPALLGRIAVVLAALAAAAAVAGATPVRTDVPWATSAPWIDVAVAPGPGTWSVELRGLTATCADPAAARGAPVDPACPATSADGSAVDVVVHVFDAVGGAEAVAPRRCTGGAACRVEVPRASSRYAVMIHGGPGAHGRITGTATTRVGAATQERAVDLAGNLMLDLGGAPTSPYDLITVLVDDPPGLYGPADPGNVANDLLGADATEAWLLDADLRVVGGDLAQAGVGAAAMIPHVEGTGARWALVRPWAAPPPGAALVAAGGGRLPVADGRKAPTVGAGRLRVLLNAAYTDATDPDGDGVSSAIEATFDTCDGRRAFAADRACTTMAFVRASPTRAWMDPRDTDGDGLSDGAELLGSDRARGTPPMPSGACAAPAPVDVADADQTLPRWSFDPRHKDALIELDLAAGNQATCPTATSGCPADGSTAPDASQLVIWQAKYDGLPARQVNNPDHQPGIRLHFDVRLPAASTAGHGTRAEFRVTDAGGQARPGLVLYQPDGGGSQCSCDGAAMCADPRHGGFARYAVDGGGGVGGGNSSCDSPISYGTLGLAAAHEMGHHLGLQHGGPTQCLGNPFGLDPQVVPEIVLPNKLIFDSPMSYLVIYDPRAQFSTGARGFTLPRAVTPDGPLVYPERGVYQGGAVDLMAQALGAQASGEAPPRTCPPSTSCPDIDLDFDGRTDHDVRLPVTGGYYFGRDFVTQVNSYWCATEQEPIFGGGCCTAPTTPGAAHQCIAPSTATEATLAHTMLVAGSPATAIAAGRWYEVFVDDQITDDDVGAGQVPPRRCGATAARDTGCTPLPPGQPLRGKLRWGRVTSWSIASERGSATPCRGNGSQCGVGVARGDLRLGGPADDAAIWGNVVMALGTIGDGGDQRVVLAWAQRGSATASGFDCAGAACASGWSRLHLRGGAAATLETAGVDVVGAADLTFPAGEDPRVSGVAIVRWNPLTGAGDTTLLIARQALTGRLWWATCGRGGCGEATRLGGAGTAIVSDGPIAAAAENPGGAAAPRLVIAYSGGGRLQMMVATAGSAVPAPAPRPVQLPNGLAFAAAPEAAVSIAFTKPGDDRLIAYWEAGEPTTYVASGRAHTLDDPGAITLGYMTSNPWDLTRMAQDLDATGAPRPRQGPGAVPALVYDPRTGVTDDPALAVMERRVRAFMSVVGQGALFNQTVTTADGEPDVAFHDYDEVAAMAWGLCPTVADSGLGARGPDLDAGFPPLRCPTAADWPTVGPRIRELALCRALGGRCLRFVDPRERVINPAERVSWPVLVADYLRSPARRGLVAAAPAPAWVAPDVARAAGVPACRVGASAVASSLRPVRDGKELRARFPLLVPRARSASPTHAQPVAP